MWKENELKEEKKDFWIAKDADSMESVQSVIAFWENSSSSHKFQVVNDFSFSTKFVENIQVLIEKLAKFCFSKLIAEMLS